MSLVDVPPYILQIQTNLRARPIPWEGAVRAGTITDADLKKIKSVDKVRKEQRKQTIEGDKEGFATLFVGNDAEIDSIFAKSAKRPEILQYLLVLFGDIIEDNESFVNTVIRQPQPYVPFQPLLQASSNPEEPIPLLSATVLSSLISHSLVTFPKLRLNTEEAIPKLLTYLSKLSKASDTSLQNIAVQQYSAILRSSSARELFWQNRKENFDPLIETLRSAIAGKDLDAAPNGRSNGSIRSVNTDMTLGGGVSIQLMYHILLIVWQLSFEADRIATDLDEEHNIVPLLVNLLRASPKEKITRLLLATLNNLLSSSKSALLPAAIQARLPNLLNNVQGRKIQDEDLQADLESLKKMLDEYSKSQTTFDEYATEVKSGHLRWSPPHRSEQFWKENAGRIADEDKGALVKKLAEILSKDWDADKQVLAIGCNDVAWLVKEVPEKKATFEKLGLKTRVMSLMQADDEAVRWESLRAVGEWLRYSFGK